MDLPVAWTVARASGLVAFGLLTLTMWLGLAMSTNLLGGRRKAALMGWHDPLAWCALAATGLHGLALAADPVVRFGLADLLVPFAASWRPAAVAAGVTAAWLSLAVTLSFRYRRRIGAKAWRRLHYASFAAFGLAVAHALSAGTDMAGVPGRLAALVAVGPALWLALVRILTPGRAPRRAPVRPPAAGA